MTVEWRKHPRYPEYELSSEGDVRSIYTMRPLVGRLDKDGYRALVLCTGGRRLNARVASMVLEAWVGPRPAGFVVRHLNGVRADNRPSNLAWGTQKDNIGDKITHGTQQLGERGPRAILTEEQARRAKFGSESVSALAAEFGVARITIYQIRAGRNWRHLQPEST